MFNDRYDAGQQLAAALGDYRSQDAIVLAIPRGGVEVGYQVAIRLAVEFALIIVRKLPWPDNPEAGFGAVAEDGSVYLVPEARRGLPAITMERILREQKAEIVRRARVLRRGAPLPDLARQRVILVDDGIATGATTQAAVLCCRRARAGKVIVAAPVAAAEAHAALEKTADQVVVLLKPRFFQAVADFYRHWHDVSDEEALALLREAGQTRPKYPSA